VAFANLYVNASTLIKSGKLLILPTGALIGKENDSTLKYILDEYVKLGGTIIVFAQQYGDHFDKVVPIPEGETLKSYGWREDRSCLKNSSFFRDMHPIFSSSTKGLIDAGIDGYFSAIPSTATVLLTRKKNRHAALIAYPYGENGGKVILTALYTDWAYSHSQATTSELRIVRDLVTWAKAPNTEIPMFNLADNSTPEISLNINIKNNLEVDPDNVSATTATKAKIYVYTPNKKTLLFETEQALTLNAGESASAALSFTLPVQTSKNYGICHTEYELYDADDNLIQMKSESFEGRFSIYKLDTPFTGNDNGYFRWISLKDQYILPGNDVVFNLHFKNNTDTLREIDAPNPIISVAHGSTYYGIVPPVKLQIPPGKEIIYPIAINFTEHGMNFKGSVTLALCNDRQWSQFGSNLKIVFLRDKVLTKSSILYETNNDSRVYLGDNIKYTVATEHILENPKSANSQIKIVLEKFVKRVGYFNQYDEVAILEDRVHDFSISKKINFSSVFTRLSEFKPGKYRIKFDVFENGGGTKEFSQYKYYYFKSSKISSNFSGIYNKANDVEIKGYLSTKTDYEMRINLKNGHDNSNYNINSGKVFISLKHESGDEVYNKTINNISIPHNSENTIIENFEFIPTKTGKYNLIISYIDNSMMEKRVLLNSKYIYLVTSRYKQDKKIYNYLDNANIEIEVFRGLIRAKPEYLIW
jgi:hypothetical protein